MPVPDEPDDEVGFVPPLPPEDRLWRHPSERAASRPTGAAPVPDLRRRHRTTAVLVTLVVLVVAGVTAASVVTDDRPTRTASAADPGLLDDATSIALREAIAPAVVQVSVERPDGRVSSTGLLVRRDGHLVTAADPLAGATSITVRTADGTTYNARVIGTDRTDDLAVLDIVTNDMPTARFDPDRDAAVGETVYVVDRTSDATRLWIATASIDALGQRLVAEDGSVMLDMLRAGLSAPRTPTAAILCTADGTVLGIVTTRAPRPGTSSSSTTMIAANHTTTWVTPTPWLTHVADDIIASGTLHRAWMGVIGEDPADGGGVLVRSVTVGGPADRAGVRAGDLVRSIDGAPTNSADALAVTVRSRHPGDRMAIGLVRDGVSLDVTVELREQT